METKYKVLKCKVIIIGFLGMAPLMGCNPDEPLPTLPPITQEGLNTFGCIIDGDILVPKDSKGGLVGTGAEGLSVVYRKDSLVNSLRPPYFSITASNYGHSEWDLIYLYIPSLDKPGDYMVNFSNGYTGIDSPPHTHVFANVYQPSESRQVRYLSFDGAGVVSISRFDTLNTIISGQFQLRLVDEETRTDTIEVTEGRFDINWTTLNCGKPRRSPCPE